MNKAQVLQDEEYMFPYHYIPKSGSEFTASYAWSWGIHYISAIEFIVKKIGALNVDSIADVGTGDGRLVAEIAKEYSSKKVVGIDYSKRAIQLAKAMNPSLNFLNIDIINEPPNEKYDCITLIEVFEHIPLGLTKVFVEKIKELLKDGGELLLTVPHQNKPLQEKHFQHFSNESLLEYYKDSFDVIEVLNFEKRSLLNRIISKLLVNNLFVLNNRFLKNLMYKMYVKRCFVASQQNCGRIFLHLKKKSK
jgi:SAM-dependent methyltransferase